MDNKNIVYVLIANFMFALAAGQDVKMNSNTSEGELLHVENTGSASKTGIKVVTGTNDAVSGVDASGGLYGYGVNGQALVGLYGSGISPDPYSDAVGVWGYANGGSSEYNSAIGVYGTASYGSAQWAGFFSGNVFISDYLDNPSDIMFKTNIRPLENGLSKIMVLKPKNYDMKVEEYKDRIHLPKGNQYGLIAQELETVLPDLVHSSKAPASLTPEERKKGVKKAGLEFKSVNYIALIPILVEAVQEQQAQIEAMKAEIASLKAR